MDLSLNDLRQGDGVWGFLEEELARQVLKIIKGVKGDGFRGLEGLGFWGGGELGERGIGIRVLDIVIRKGSDGFFLRGRVLGFGYGDGDGDG